MKHTKGEWEANGPIVLTGSMCCTARFICSCSTSDSISFKEASANARLIAAAPKLLDACKIGLKGLIAFEIAYNRLRGLLDQPASKSDVALDEIKKILEQAIAESEE